MEQTVNQKTILALQIIEKSKNESGYFQYRNLTTNDLVLQSIVHEFKEKFVYPTSTYIKNKELYRKGKISWDELKCSAEKIFIEQLSECNQREIDEFFGIKKMRVC